VLHKVTDKENLALV